MKKIFLNWIIPLLIFLLWYVSSVRGWVNKSILPPPEKVWNALATLVTRGTLWKHITSSMIRVIKGYLLGATFGVILGTICGLSRIAENLGAVLIGALRPIPAIALIPFFILWMGIGEESKVAVITFGSFWPILINTMHGIKSVDRKILQVGEILEKTRTEQLVHIVFPSALPSILTGLRLGVSSAWTCVVAAEMIAASSGVGFLITYSREMAQPASLLIGVLTIGLFGMIIDTGFTVLNRKIVFWNESGNGSEKKND